jgi:RNA polymerase sigma-70 factor (ECF subfamily)
MSDTPPTRRSLLARLKRDGSNNDWEQFYRQYGAVILSFCRRQGLDDFGARDVLQETMILLMRKLPAFDYDPVRGRFRNWLLTLVMGKTRDAFRRAQRVRTVSIHGHNFTDTPALDNGLVTRGSEGSEAVERAWMQSLIEEALARIQTDPKTKAETFAVFQAYMIEGRAVADVSRQFGIEENAVYQIKHRMLKRLREELDEIADPRARA